VTDPQGIFNRRYLDERLPQEAARSRRYGRPLSLVMTEAGHVVLPHVVNLAKSALRGSDWIACYGGGKFVIVLPETSLVGAHAVAERMRRICSETAVDLPDTRLPVTVSFSVATLDGIAPSNEDAQAMLRNADQALLPDPTQRESRTLVARNNSDFESANASQTDRWLQPGTSMSSRSQASGQCAPIRVDCR